MASPAMNSTTHISDNLLLATLKAQISNKTSGEEKREFCQRILEVLNDVESQMNTGEQRDLRSKNKNWRDHVLLTNVVENESKIFRDLKHTPAFHKALVESRLLTYDTLFESKSLSIKEIQSLKFAELTDREKTEKLMELLNPNQIAQLQAVLRHPTVGQSAVADLM